MIAMKRRVRLMAAGVFALAMGAEMLAAVPAQAEWKVLYRIDPDAKWHRRHESTTTTTTEEDTSWYEQVFGEGPWEPTSVGGGVGLGGTPSTVEAKITGSGWFQAVLQWEGTGSAPAYVDVKEIGNAYAEARRGTFEQFAFNSNGGPQPLASFDPILGNDLGGTVKNVVPGIAKIKDAAILRRFPVVWNINANDGAGAYEAELPRRTFSVTNIINTPADVAGDETFNTAATVFYQVGEDSRSVKLHRPGARGEIFSILPDGTYQTTGHTRWSYTERVENLDAPPDFDGRPTGYTDQPVVVSPVIGAQQIGTWSPYQNLTGIWESSGSLDRYPPLDENASHVAQMPDGGALKDEIGLDIRATSTGGGSTATYRATGWYSVPSSNPTFDEGKVTVTYILTDNADGAKASASYVFTLHDEWENKEPNNAKFWIDGASIPHIGETLGAWQCQPLHLEGHMLTTSNPESTWDVTESGSQSVTFKSGFSLDFKLADWAKVNGSAETSTTMSIASSFKASAPKPSSRFASITTGDSFQPVLKYKIRSKHWLVDHFDLMGKDLNSARTDGKWPQSAETDILQMEPDWLRIPSGYGPTTSDQPFPEPTPAPTPTPTPLPGG